MLRPAILWNDQRSAAQAAELHERAGAKIIATSLNRVNPTWTLAMLAWLQENEPAVIAQTKRLYLAKDYLRFCLTGSWETDFSDAIGALLGDNATKGWSPELGALIGWDMAHLPPIVPHGHRGGVTAEPPRAPGCRPGRRGVRLQRHHGRVFRHRRGSPGSAG